MRIERQTSKRAETPEEVVFRAQLERTVSTMLLSLPVAEERVLRLRFGVGTTHEHTYAQVGGTLGVDREAARSLVDKALRRCRLSKWRKALMEALAEI